MNDLRRIGKRTRDLGKDGDCWLNQETLTSRAVDQSSVWACKRIPLRSENFPKNAFCVYPSVGEVKALLKPKTSS